MPTEDEVIERMAKAIYNSYWNDMVYIRWEEISEFSKNIARKQARAALKVMQDIAHEENIV